MPFSELARARPISHLFAVATCTLVTVGIAAGPASADQALSGESASVTAIDSPAPVESRTEMPPSEAESVPEIADDWVASASEGYPGDTVSVSGTCIYRGSLYGQEVALSLVRPMSDLPRYESAQTLPLTDPLL